MSKKKTKFTKEFKLQAIKLVTKEGYTQAEAAKNLGIDGDLSASLCAIGGRVD